MIGLRCAEVAREIDCKILAERAIVGRLQRGSDKPATERRTQRGRARAEDNETCSGPSREPGELEHRVRMAPRPAPEFVQLPAAADNHIPAFSDDLRRRPPMLPLPPRSGRNVECSPQRRRDARRDPVHALQAPLDQPAQSPVRLVPPAKTVQGPCIEGERVNAVPLSRVSWVERKGDDLHERQSGANLLDRRRHDGGIAEIAEAARAEHGDRRRLGRREVGARIQIHKVTRWSTCQADAMEVIIVEEVSICGYRLATPRTSASDVTNTVPTGNALSYMR